MVPYVRKSFAKHYQVGLEFLEETDEKRDDSLSIDCEYYKSKPKVYDYAMKQTLKELNQAVEGMFHNLNTLQSRSGNQLEVYVAA